jgi:hypothetical protein
MKKQRSPKLILNRESLSRLDRDTSLANVAGGSLISVERPTCHVLSICDACPG